MAAITGESAFQAGEGFFFEDVRAMLRETAAEFDREMKEFQKSRRESKKEFDREMKEFQESRRESKKEIDAIYKEIAEMQKENARERKITEQIIKETGLQMKETDKRMGKLYNRFGELAEHLVAPNIEEKFNKLGFQFTRTQPNVRIKEFDNPDISAEIDLFLENGDVAIAVEVKSKPNQEHVDDHVTRMEKLRIYADKRHDKRRYQGAVAGAILSDSIRAYILKKGFYLIEQTGDTVKINIPNGFIAREW